MCQLLAVFHMFANSYHWIIRLVDSVTSYLSLSLPFDTVILTEILNDSYCKRIHNIPTLVELSLSRVTLLLQYPPSPSPPKKPRVDGQQKLPLSI